MPPETNQKPEQVARDQIDDRLRAAGWHVQDKDTLDFNAGLGIAVREYQTDIGPADYLLFVDRQAVGVVEAKPDPSRSRRRQSSPPCFQVASFRTSAVLNVTT